MESLDRRRITELFVRLCSAWNRTHRIIGGDVSLLLEQSLIAWENSLSRIPDSTDCLVDVGSGSGVAAIPLLWLRPGLPIVLLEPDYKKVAFLVSLKGELGSEFPLFVVGSRIEDVSRETMAKEVGFSSASTLLFARAFSGSLNLSEARALSAFKNDAWLVFSEKNKSFVFDPLKIN